MSEQKKLLPYIESHSELYSLWNIDRRKTNRILKKYTRLYEHEISALKSQEIQLSPYFKDVRSDEEYAYDIINAWAIEDIFSDVWLYSNLKKFDPNIEVILSGADKDRNLEKIRAKNVMGIADFVFKSYGRQIDIELQMSRKRRSSYDMKTNKVNRLRSSGGKFIWLVLETNSFFVCNPSTDLDDIKVIKNHLWGGKEVYRLKSKDIKMYNIQDGLTEEIVEMLCNE